VSSPVLVGIHFYITLPLNNGKTGFLPNQESEYLDCTVPILYNVILKNVSEYGTGISNIECSGSGSAWIHIKLNGRIRIRIKMISWDTDPHQFVDDKPKCMEALFEQFFN
jgi:hypothetical protein